MSGDWELGSGSSSNREKSYTPLPAARSPAQHRCPPAHLHRPVRRAKLRTQRLRSVGVREIAQVLQRVFIDALLHSQPDDWVHKVVCGP